MSDQKQTWADFLKEIEQYGSTHCAVSMKIDLDSKMWTFHVLNNELTPNSGHYYLMTRHQFEVVYSLLTDLHMYLNFDNDHTDEFFESLKSSLGNIIKLIKEKDE